MTNYWRSWKPEDVKRAVKAQLVANGEIAGKFVETDARRRLTAITVPEWGEKYRNMVVGRLLTSFVEEEAQAVVIWVGVRKGPKGSQHGLWIEVGTRGVRGTPGKPGRPGHPAHPFLRPAVFENARKILALLAGK